MHDYRTSQDKETLEVIVARVTETMIYFLGLRRKHGALQRIWSLQVDL